MPIQPTLEELQKAKPLPHFLEEWDPDPEVFAWIINNIDSWKPRRPEGLKGGWLQNPIKYKDDLEYTAILKTNDGKIYLTDGTAYSMIYEADGTKTAEEIVEMLIQEFLEVAKKEDPENPILQAFKKGETNDYTDGIFYMHYRHLAMLKKEGLLL